MLLVVLFSMCLRPAPAATTFIQHNAMLTEWVVPTPHSSPSALTLDQSGSCCWFVENSGNKLSHFDPNTGTFQEWLIPTNNANPFGLTVAPIQDSPTLWGTEFGSNKIFAFSPAQNVLREYSLPHHSGAAYISVEPGGSQVRVWFTELIRNTNGELIYDPSTQNVTLYEDTFPADAGGGAYGVYAGSNSVWFAGFSAIVRWDRASQQYTMWQLPVHGSALGRFITLDRYGQVWYTQGSDNATSNDNFVGVLRGGSTVQEWRLPSTGADPRGLTINPATQQPWIAERSLGAANGAVAVLSNSSGGTLVSSAVSTAPSGGTPTSIGPTLTKLAPSSNTVTPVETRISSAASKLFDEYSLGASSPQDVVVDSKGDIWISEPAANKIARLSGLTPSFALNAYPPFISISQGGSGTVSMTGSSISGYAGTVTISAVDLPNDVTYSVEPNRVSILAGGNASSTLVLQATSNATPRTAAITFQASDGTIAHSVSILLTIANSTTGPPAKPQCLIVTATFGSQLSPQVELLRRFRDNVVSSRTGASFLLMFNAWYYSFSPGAASYISDNSQARPLMKSIIYPLIGSLTLALELYSLLSGYPEYATLLSGLLASSMIGIFYLGLPWSFIMRKFRLAKGAGLRVCGASLLLGLSGILLGLNSGSAALLMIAGPFTVLSTMFGSAALVGGVLASLFQGINGRLADSRTPALKEFAKDYAT